MEYSMRASTRYIKVPSFNHISFWAWFTECTRVYNEAPPLPNSNKVCISESLLLRVMRSTQGSIISVDDGELHAMQKVILRVAQLTGKQFIRRHGPYMFAVMNTFIFDESTEIIQGPDRFLEVMPSGRVQVAPDIELEEFPFDPETIPLAVSRPSEPPPSWGPQLRSSTPHGKVLEDAIQFHDTLQDMDLHEEES